VIVAGQAAPVMSDETRLVPPMSLGNRLAASLLTVASLAGLLGLATFGRFTNETEPLTSSVVMSVPSQPGG